MLALLAERSAEVWLRLGEHIVLAGTSTAFAVLIGMPLGILASRHPRLGQVVTATAGITQTIPSLAMLAFLLTWFNRIGFAPAITALTLYALLPVIRNTLTGFQTIPPETREAARGVGMTASQQLWIVELPLALPSIITGIRTAAVVGVGIATLSAFVGAGGLGQFINRGLSLSNHQLIMLGAIPSAILAIIIDNAIGAVHWAISPAAKRNKSPRVRVLRNLALATPLLILGFGLMARSSSLNSGSNKPAETVRIGSKNFTEQLIIGELLAQLIEHQSDLQVERRFGLGGTMICHEALLAGEIDLYAEYTGTGLTAILNQDLSELTAPVAETVSKAYESQFGLRWLRPFGFNNTYAITVRSSDAARLNWKKISDLVGVSRSLKAGWSFEFSERPDGYPGLRTHYGLDFGQSIDLETSLMYEAIAQGEVDVICAFATDGRIAANSLTPLQDDQAFFPPYEAAPVIRMETLTRHPQLESILNQLSNIIKDDVMRSLNEQVDIHQQSPAQVAKQFLEDNKILSE